MDNNLIDAERYVQHLDEVVGRPESRIHQLDSVDPSLQKVSVFVYEDWPKEGFVTGFSFGLSLASHPDWRRGRPEVMISVNSHDQSWPYAAGYLVNQLRGKCPFSYGNTINYQEKISKESDLDAFLVFAPPFLTREEQSIQFASFTCNIVGLYPLYSTELPLLDRIGLEAFWHLPEWDPMNVHRLPLA